MNGILLPRTVLQSGSIHPSSGVLSRGGIIAKGDEVIPLSEIPMILRLQTHGGNFDGIVYDVEVSGAGQMEVNGLYRCDGTFDGKPSFRHTSVDSRIIWFSGWQPYPVWLLNGPNGPIFISLTNVPLPPNEGWFDVGGGGAVPSFTLIPHVRLKPNGLYQDTACTIPATEQGDAIAAWRDELSGSGVVAAQDVFAKRPLLRFVDGVPVVTFDGVDDVLVISSNLIGHSGDQSIAAAFTIDDFGSYGGVITSKSPFTDSSPSIEIEPPGSMITGTFGASSHRTVSTWAGENHNNRRCAAVLVRTGTTGEFFLDGSSAGTASGLTGEGAHAPQTYIGTARAQEGNYFDGDITAILVTPRTDVTSALSNYVQSLAPS